MSEQEKLLVSRCQKGDLHAYDLLMQKYEKKVYTLCYRMTGNKEDAADLAQESFLKAFRALPSFQGQSSFSTWLFRIVTNTCLDERRKRQRKPHIYSLDNPLSTADGEIQLEFADEGPGPLQITLEQELQKEIQELLHRLPPKQRAIIIMRDLQGFSYEEMAEALEISLGTVKSRLSRARSRLRELYLQREEQKESQLHLKEKRGADYEL
ncbi:MAG: sigma-70 family RNA polymerase sigma factor [Firmicutes bacterium]|nr:sigma-70 family RNA polymerase sigma factor [Bacillota bacterium]